MTSCSPSLFIWEYLKYFALIKSFDPTEHYFARVFQFFPGISSFLKDKEPSVFYLNAEIFLSSFFVGNFSFSVIIWCLGKTAHPLISLTLAVSFALGLVSTYFSWLMPPTIWLTQSSLIMERMKKCLRAMRTRMTVDLSPPIPPSLL